VRRALKYEKNIIAPFCIFFIIIGIGGVIILPFLNAFFEFNEDYYNKVFHIIWAIGAITALLYHLIVLREFLRKSVAEKILYCFLSIIFLSLIFVPVFR
jgi:hypothetical protein